MPIDHVPFLDLVTPHRELEEDLVAAFRQSLASAAFIGGPQVEMFEREFADYCGTAHCIGVGSGTDALRFALLAAGVTPGDAVITVAHTFIATVEAISQAGAVTEFVEIDERTYNMSPDALDEYLQSCRKDSAGRLLGRRTRRPLKAIVPVHLYGQVAEMDRILALAGRHNLLVVEDACQAHGAEYLTGRGAPPRRAEVTVPADGNGSMADPARRSSSTPAGTATWKRAGSFGAAAAFSFYPGKNLGACGEGGAVTTNDEAIARTVRMLRDHGQSQKYHHELEGYNGRLDAIQAAALRIKLRRLDGWTAARRNAAYRYNELLAATRLRAFGCVPPHEPAWSRAVYHLYVLRVRERERLIRQLNEAGVHTGLHYPVPVHLQNCYRAWGYGLGSLPVTERVAKEVLSLPMFPTLTAEQQMRVVDALAASCVTA